MRWRAPSCTLLHNLLTWKSMRSFYVPPCRISEGAMHLGTVARNLALLRSIRCATGPLAGQERSTIPMSQHVSYRTVKVDGRAMCNREAAAQETPTMLFL